jgi:hypothetical protein
MHLQCPKDSLSRQRIKSFHLINLHEHTVVPAGLLRRNPFRCPAYDVLFKGDILVAVLIYIMASTELLESISKMNPIVELLVIPKS